MKDSTGATQFLLIPTKKIRGIESRSVRARGATNYFAEAWKARGLTEKVLGRAMPSDTMSLAVNSEFGRTQNQLHIHIDCIRADVRKALHSQRSKITGRWASLNKPLVGHHYMAMRIVGTDARRPQPFQAAGAGHSGSENGHGTTHAGGCRRGIGPRGSWICHPGQSRRPRSRGQCERRGIARSPLRVGPVKRCQAVRELHHCRPRVCVASSPKRRVGLEELFA